MKKGRFGYSYSQSLGFLDVLIILIAVGGAGYLKVAFENAQPGDSLIGPILIMVATQLPWIIRRVFGEQIRRRLERVDALGTMGILLLTAGGCCFAGALAFFALPGTPLPPAVEVTAEQLHARTEAIITHTCTRDGKELSGDACLTEEERRADVQSYADQARQETAQARDERDEQEKMRLDRRQGDAMGLAALSLVLAGAGAVLFLGRRKPQPEEDDEESDLAGARGRLEP